MIRVEHRELHAAGDSKIRHWTFVSCDGFDLPRTHTFDWRAAGTNQWNLSYFNGNVAPRWESGGHRKGFYLGSLKDWRSVDKRMHRGWGKGAEKASKLVEQVAGKVAEPVSVRRRVRWGDEGDEYSRERLLDGHFDSAWRSSGSRFAVANPILTIAINWGGNSNLTQDELFWSGAAAIALIQILEGAGYQTNLYAYAGNQYGHDLPSIGKTKFPYGREGRIAMSICLKRSGEFVRPDMLMAALAGPSFRTYGFRMLASGKYRTDQGLGSMMYNPTTALAALVHEGHMENPSVTLPAARDRTAAQRSVRNALKDLAAANLAALPEGVTW